MYWIYVIIFIIIIIILSVTSRQPHVMIRSQTWGSTCGSLIQRWQEPKNFMWPQLPEVGKGTLAHWKAPAAPSPYPGLACLLPVEGFIWLGQVQIARLLSTGPSGLHVVSVNVYFQEPEQLSLTLESGNLLTWRLHQCCAQHPQGSINIARQEEM